MVVSRTNHRAGPGWAGPGGAGPSLALSPIRGRSWERHAPQRSVGLRRCVLTFKGGGLMEVTFQLHLPSCICEEEEKFLLSEGESRGLRLQIEPGRLCVCVQLMHPGSSCIAPKTERWGRRQRAAWRRGSEPPLPRPGGH